jgi:hypothetical protein
MRKLVIVETYAYFCDNCGKELTSGYICCYSKFNKDKELNFCNNNCKSDYFDKLDLKYQPKVNIL